MVHGLCIIAAYCFSAILVNAAYHRMNRGQEAPTRYVLYTLDQQAHIEWVIRSLIFVHWFQGRPASITVIDEGSSDDTLTIVRLLSRQYPIEIRFVDDLSEQQPRNDTAIHIRLGHPEDMHKLSQLQSLR